MSRSLKGCVLVVAAVLLLAIVSLATLYVSANRKAKAINEANVAAAKPIIDALERYRQTAHRYPATLCDLHLNARPVFVEFTRIYYTSSQDGTEYWLAIFPYLEGHLVMPSDSVNEYSSGSRRWSVTDYNDGKARGDEAWNRNCAPEPSPHRSPSSGLWPPSPRAAGEKAHAPRRPGEGIVASTRFQVVQRSNSRSGSSARISCAFIPYRS